MIASASNGGSASLLASAEVIGREDSSTSRASPLPGDEPLSPGLRGLSGSRNRDSAICQSPPSEPDSDGSGPILARG